MILETSPETRPWAWYAGTFNQYHAAFLLLIEIYAFPKRKEADRIWRVLDYVFEMPPDLSRAQKSHLILTEIRDRIGAYSEARKLRAPTGMLQRLGQQPPRRVGDIGEIPLEPSPPVPKLMVPSEHPSPGTTNAEYRWTLPVQSPPGLESSSDTTSRTGSVTDIPQPMSMSDDLMADINWVCKALLSSLFSNPPFVLANPLFRTNGINCFPLTSIPATSILFDLPNPVFYFLVVHVYNHSYLPIRGAPVLLGKLEPY